MIDRKTNKKYTNMESKIVKHYYSDTIKENNSAKDESEIKRSDSGILTDLLKSFKNNRTNSLEKDSGHDSDGSTTSETDYKSLLIAMSTCVIKDEKQNGIIKTDDKVLNDLNDSRKLENVSEKLVENNKNDKNIMKSLDNHCQNKTNYIKNLMKKDDVITLQVRKPKSSKNHDNNAKQENKKKAKSGDTNGQNDNKNINKLANKLSDLNLNNDKKLIKIKTESCQHKRLIKDVQIVQDDENKKKDKDGEKKHSTKILIERGPVRCNSNNAHVKCPPYERQINKNTWSGGKVMVKDAPPDIDLIPSTVNIEQSVKQNKKVYHSKLSNNNNNYKALTNIVNHLKKDESKFLVNKSVENQKFDNDFVNWEEDLSMLMEILEGDAMQKNLIQANYKFKENHSKQQQEIIENLLKNDNAIPHFKDNVIEYDCNIPPVLSISYDKNDHFLDSNLSSPLYSDDDTVKKSKIFNSSQPLPIQQNTYNQNKNLLMVPSDYSYNISPHSSPIQGFQSPSIENVDNIYCENALLYESSVPSTSRESRSSISSSDSPKTQLQDNIFNFIDASLLNINTQIYGDFAYNPSSVSSETSSLNKSPAFSTLSSYSPASENNFDYTPSYNSPPSMSNLDIETQNCPLMIENEFIRTSYENTEYFTSNQNRAEIIVANSPKNMKKKVIPIACKEMYPCCVECKKTAKQVLEEMFNRLDDRMKKMICFEIHSVSDDKLLELFDGQLSSWNDSLGTQFPRMPLLHATCERLLMRAKTMEKFFEVYVNGHTLLDRAILMCSQNPIVVKYFAECMVRASPHLLPNESTIEKTDASGNTVLHRAAAKGEQCAIALSSLLSLNNASSSLIFNVNRLNSEGQTPLHIACSRHIPISSGYKCSCQLTVHVLLQHGSADPNIRDGKSGNTPLHVAVDTAACAPALVAQLLKFGAKPSIRNYGGVTPLDLARTACRSAVQSQYSKQVVDMLKKLK